MTMARLLPVHETQCTCPRALYHHRFVSLTMTVNEDVGDRLCLLAVWSAGDHSALLRYDSGV